MLFTELKTEIKERLNITSTASDTRIGRLINKEYREITSSIGLSTSRHTAVSQVASIGSREVIFTGVEKIETVWTENDDAKPTILKPVLLAELRGLTVSASDNPKVFAVKRIGSNSVTVWMDVTAETAFTLYADGTTEVSDLSGSNEPAFPESFNDIIIEGVLKDEYQKLEKTTLADRAEVRFQRRLSDLRMFIAKSNFLDIYQGKKSAEDGRVMSGGGSTAGASIGSTALTITAAWTFDRGSAVAPFTIDDSDAAYVTNLGAAFVGNVTTD